MPNGKSLLLEWKAKITCGDIPQNVTNTIIMTALVELWDSFGEMKDSIDEISKKMQVDDVSKKDNLTGSKLWEGYGKEIVKWAIILVLAYVAARAGMVVP